MKMSKMIEQAQALLDEYGDQDVVVSIEETDVGLCTYHPELVVDGPWRSAKDKADGIVGVFHISVQLA